MKQKWSIPMRIYHWANSLTLTLLLTTVVLRKTVINKYFVNQKIQDFLTNININLDKDVTMKLAKQIRSEMWEWHYVFGFTLSALILIRIFLFFTKSGKATIKDAIAIFYKNKTNKSWIKALYLGIYLSIFIISTTGVLMYFEHQLSLTHDTTELLENIHVAVMNIIIYFIPIHIIGVVLAENDDEKGITSDMINGGSTEESKK